MNMELAREYIALKRERDKRRMRDAEISERMSSIESQLLDEMLSEGVQRTTLDDHTIYLSNRKYWSIRKDVDRLEAIDKLIATWPELATVNSNTLNAMLAETVEEGNLPSDIEPLITYSETVQVKVRAA